MTRKSNFNRWVWSQEGSESFQKAEPKTCKFQYLGTEDLAQEYSNLEHNVEELWYLVLDLITFTKPISSHPFPKFPMHFCHAWRISGAQVWQISWLMLTMMMMMMMIQEILPFWTHVCGGGLRPTSCGHSAHSTQAGRQMSLHLMI